MTCDRTLRQQAINVLESAQTHEQHISAMRYADLAVKTLEGEIAKSDGMPALGIANDISAIKTKQVTEAFKWMDGAKTNTLYF